MDLTFVWPFDGAAFVWRSDPSLGLLTVVINATFALDGSGEARPVRPRAPERGERVSADGSLLDASDFAPWKPRGEVFVVGHVHGRGAGRVRAGFSAGGVRKSLLVYGERRRRGGGPSAPLGFDRVPIAYGRAPRSPENPVGIDVAFLAEGGAWPNFEEDPEAPARVVGLSPVAPGWPQRALSEAADRAFAEAILGGAGVRAGSASARLDFAHFNAAPVDQQTERLDLAAPVELFALHPDAPELFARLPDVRPRLAWEGPGAAGPLEPIPDTLRIDADAGTITVTWRATAQLPSAETRHAGRVLVSPAAPLSPSAPLRRAPSEPDDWDDDGEARTSPSIRVDRQALAALPSPAPPALSYSAPETRPPPPLPGAPERGFEGGMAPSSLPAPPVLPFIPPRAWAMPDAPDDGFGTKRAPISRDLDLAAALPFLARPDPSSSPALPFVAPRSPSAAPPSPALAPAPPYEDLPFRRPEPPPASPAPEPAPRETLPPAPETLPPAAAPWSAPPALAASALFPPTFASARETWPPSPPEPPSPPPGPLSGPPPEAAGEPAPSAPDASLPAPAPADGSPQELSIEEYGILCAELADGQRPRAEVLARAELAEARLPATAEAMDSRVAQSPEDGARFDEAYVRAHAVLSKVDAAGYARLFVALEREGPLAAIAPLGIPLADLIRLQRVWTRRVAADPELAGELRLQMDEARRA